MTIWNVSQAKSRFSELLHSARGAPQRVQSRGRDVAVVLSTAEFDKLRAAAEKARPGKLAAFLELTANMKRDGDLAIDLPARRAHRRDSPFEE